VLASCGRIPYLPPHTRAADYVWPTLSSSHCYYCCYYYCSNYYYYCYYYYYYYDYSFTTSHIARLRLQIDDPFRCEASTNLAQYVVHTLVYGPGQSILGPGFD